MDFTFGTLVLNVSTVAVVAWALAFAVAVVAYAAMRAYVATKWLPKRYY